MPNDIFVKHWSEAGVFIAMGNPITSSDLYALYDEMRIDRIKPSFLPHKNTIIGKVSERKAAIFKVAERLWGYTPYAWLKLEKTWLKEAREKSGSQETGGKNNINDVVSAEILVRIVAAAKLVTEDKEDKEITDEAIRALNLFIQEVCAKGRTRMEMVDVRSVYSILRNGGLAIGSSGSKYLPNPEGALPWLLLRLHRDRVYPNAYKK